MASLNLSINGPSISKSYQSIVDAPPPTGAAAASSTYGQWAVFSVSAPLANAFQDAGNKESVLKVQSTGEGELVDLIDEFSDGRIQFAYLKIKDPNTGLPKSALIAWCGEGVPERTKGYFTSHVTAVAKLLHGYHVQVTARSDRDLTPEGIVQKIADASGSKYSASSAAPPPVAAATKPLMGNKQAFTPTASSGGFNPSAARTGRKVDTNVDEDGWGADAPEVTRTQLEKVQSAYKPTKVNMRELTSQQPAASAFNTASDPQSTAPEVVRGAYQPVGKVDIAAIRRQAKESGQLKDDRPEIVKGSYEPIGKVDIAAIRAKSQKPENASERVVPTPADRSEESDEPSPSLAQRSAAFTGGAERLTTLPKPKVANKFGGGSSFAGTKAPLPGGFEARSNATSAPVGIASKNFADQGGKTPAQIWAEKKARVLAASGSGGALPASGFTGALPVTEQKSGTPGQWESGYTGKKWGAVNTTHTGQSAESGGVASQQTGDEDREEVEDASSAGGIGALRNRFAGAAPMGAPAASGFDRSPPPAPAPAPETSTKPNRGVPIPGLSSAGQEEEYNTPALPTPPVQPRSPTPPTPEARDTSPIRVAVPVSSRAEVTDAHEEQIAPPPALPIQSLGRNVPEPEDDEPERGPDPARAAAQSAAAVTTGTPPTAGTGAGDRARAEYDYDAAEDNEVSLQEGDIVTDVQKIDPDWWLVTNPLGQTGLVPSNYLAELEDDAPAPAASAVPQPPAPALPAAPPAASGKGPSAVAEYDYEAGEDNELSFPENATITNIEFPDDDWWHGEYQGRAGLFPAAYVKLNK